MAGLLERFAPTTNKPKPAPRPNGYSHLPTTRRGHVASSAVLSPGVNRTPTTMRATGLEEWQTLAMHHYDICAELSYVTGFEARSASKARLFAATLNEDPKLEPLPIDDENHPANEAMRAFLGGPVGQSEGLATIAAQKLIVGISYLVSWDEREEGELVRKWFVLSPREVSYQKGQWTFTIKGERVVKPDQGPGSAWVLRHWNPHPFDAWAPTSPTRALLPILNELEGLTKHVSSIIDSRLAGAGVLLLPNEVDFPYDPDDLPEGENPVSYQLVKVAQDAITNPESANARVPVVLQIPGEYISDVQHITFSNDLDAYTSELRKELVRRIALGLDIPPEILLGLGSSTQWASWQVEEATIKLHTEPKLAADCNSFTTGWLRPFLKAKGVPDPERYVVWFDTTALKLRPNRAADAKSLHDDLLITDETRRLASGFSEDEAPNNSQFREQLIRKVITDSPQLSLNMLPLVGIDPVIIPGQEPGQVPDQPESEEPDSPTPDDDTQPGPSEQPREIG